jgi:thioesterase domain-containing protein/acyl carrier protein
VSLDPARSAYIFYTSGTTGTPKGVVDCHRNVLHNVMRYTNNLGVTVEDRFSLVQSPNFSGTVSSLFSALLNGATICPFDLRSNGVERLADWIVTEEITIFHSVPGIFEQLHATGKNFDSLRIVRLEGDQTFRRHVEMFQRKFKNGCVLANGLGTTETGLIRQYFINGDPAFDSKVVPVGYATEDMEITLLDDNGTPIAQGDVGEINVRSTYLAQGYWGREDLTANAFRHSYGPAGTRSYATGDLGRLRPDDCLEYLGRKDVRAKLRGQAIDLALIENALCDLEFIDQAVVTVCERDDGYDQLVAYVVAGTADLPAVSAMRRSLAKSLPDLMLPARYVLLDQLPVDRHNKIDRRTLAPPDSVRPFLEQELVEAETEQQRIIAECFRQVLRIDTVGLDDDFVELGGDSLMATELLSLVREKLGVSCPIDHFYPERTIAALDRKLGEVRDGNIMVTLQSSGTRPPLFCLHNHAGHVLEYQQLAQLLGPEQPVIGVRSINTLNNVVHFRLEDMAARYIKEIRRTQPNGPYHLCGNCFGGLLAFEVAQQLRRNGEEVGLLALIDSACPAGTMTRLSRRLGISRNWAELSALPMRERLSRLGGKLYRLLRWVARRLRGHIAFVQAERSPDSSQPSRRHIARLEDVHHKVEDRYRPQAYNGKMVLICHELRENQRGWSKVGGKNLRILQLDKQESPLRNPHLVEEPYVHDLASELSSLMADAGS